jgi:3-oxoacyl-[acyl-carrier protein] reductase
MNLTGKVALITGGAFGIGESITRKLASLGAHVVINYNKSVQPAQTLKSELEALGSQVEIVQANISSFEEAAQLVEKAIARFGRIDILVNNAGITQDSLIMRMNEDQFDQVIQTNLKGSWAMSKHVIKYMVKQRAGKIINISSVVALTGSAGQTNYAASKAGVIGLTKALAREVAKRGITVNAIAPGLIRTQMTASLDEAILKSYLEQIPMGRPGEAEEVANLVGFLASDLANYITGQTIAIDGGMVMY